MDSILQILAALLMVTGGLLALWSIFSDKGRRSLEKFIEIESKIRSLMIEVENFTDMNGEEKKNYVLAQVELHFPDLALCEDFISNIIEGLIDISKRINKPK